MHLNLSQTASAYPFKVNRGKGRECWKDPLGDLGPVAFSQPDLLYRVVERPQWDSLVPPPLALRRKLGWGGRKNGPLQGCLPIWTRLWGKIQEAPIISTDVVFITKCMQANKMTNVHRIICHSEHIFNVTKSDINLKKILSPPFSSAPRRSPSSEKYSNLILLALPSAPPFSSTMPILKLSSLLSACLKL